MKLVYTKSGMVADGPRKFYGHYRPASDLDAEKILYWIALQLDEVPDRANYKWRVWLSEMAYGMVKERFWPSIDLEGYDEYIMLYSPSDDAWEIRLKIAGTQGDYEDLNSDIIFDKVSITLEVDDGRVPGMP